MNERQLIMSLCILRIDLHDIFVFDYRFPILFLSKIGLTPLFMLGFFLLR